MAAAYDISASDLRKFLHYSPQTGVFTWARRLRCGEPAGSTHTSGFIRIKLHGRDYYAHNLAWLWVYGEASLRQLVHVNGVRSDNRLSNLRERDSNLVDARYLRARLNYDEDTGEFTWASDGSPLCVNSSKVGYLQAKFGGKKYYVHRLAWLWAYQAWPDGLIDHINRNKSDNRLSNLRVVSSSENGQNRLTPNRYGLPGACLTPTGHWETSVTFMGERVRVSGMDTPEEASEMYFELKRRLHDTYTHL